MRDFEREREKRESDEDKARKRATTRENDRKGRSNMFFNSLFLQQKKRTEGLAVGKGKRTEEIPFSKLC